MLGYSDLSYFFSFFFPNFFHIVNSMMTFHYMSTQNNSSSISGSFWFFDAVAKTQLFDLRWQCFLTEFWQENRVKTLVPLKAGKIALSSGYLLVLKRIALHLLLPSVYMPGIREENHFLASWILSLALTSQIVCFHFYSCNPKKSPNGNWLSISLKSISWSPKDFQNPWKDLCWNGAESLIIVNIRQTPQQEPCLLQHLMC